MTSIKENVSFPTDNVIIPHNFCFVSTFLKFSQKKRQPEYSSDCHFDRILPYHSSYFLIERRPYTILKGNNGDVINLLDWKLIQMTVSICYLYKILYIPFLKQKFAFKMLLMFLLITFT